VGTVADAHLEGYTLRYARVPGENGALVQDTLWQTIKTDITAGLEEGLLAEWDSSNQIRVYLPPNVTSENAVVGIRLLDEQALPAWDESYLTLAGAAFEIESVPVVELDLRKPATLRVAYMDEEVRGLDEGRLALFKASAVLGWQRIGGTVDFVAQMRYNISRYRRTIQCLKLNLYERG
jgi:hypothetical protein